MQQLESDHTAELNSINENMSNMKGAHEQAIMALEANFNEKLIVEYDKYQTLESHTDKISEDYERYDWLTVTAPFTVGANGGSHVRQIITDSNISAAFELGVSHLYRQIP